MVSDPAQVGAKQYERCVTVSPPVFKGSGLVPISQSPQSLQPRARGFRTGADDAMTHVHKSRVVVPFRAPAKSLSTSPAMPPPTPLLNKFTAHVSRAKTAVAILDGLDEFASRILPVNVLGVGRMPQRTADWRSI